MAVAAKPSVGQINAAPTEFSLPNKEAFALIACVKNKGRTPAAAKDLYISQLFRKSRALAEAAGWRWFVLSARHGLLPPSRIVEPYDETISGAPRAVRREWSHRVFGQISAAIPADASIVVLAGKDYTEFLVPKLRNRGHAVYEPLEGITLYRRPPALDQLHWRVMKQRGEH